MREEAASEAAKLLAEAAYHRLLGMSGAPLELQVVVREGKNVLLTTRLTIETDKSD